MSDAFQKLSIVVPVYNEAPTVEKIVDLILDSPGTLQKEVILVDDASTDGTVDLLKSKIERRVDKVIYHEKNRGKGAALRSGFAEATGDIILIQDADLEYSPRDYPKLINPILAGRADVVFGTRFSVSEEHRVLYFWHMVGNKFLTLLSNMLTNVNLSDIETCYKVFTKDVLDRIGIDQDGFGVDPELTAKVARLGCRIYEVGISYHGRTYAQGKKIGWRDGIITLWSIFKYNFFCRKLK